MVMAFLLGLVNTFGYLGIFLASLIGNASIILPLPSAIFIFIGGKFLNPFLVGIVAAIGGAIGELTAYALGAGGGGLFKKGKGKRKNEIKKMKKKEGGWFIRANKWFQSHNGFLIVFIFSVLPLPHDVIGIICGAIRYDIKKFFIATLLGRLVMYTFIAYAGYYGLGFAANYFV
jgi:membrane protein YqaA with SNARE-associated domain